jgi:hypothetical protein
MEDLSTICFEYLFMLHGQKVEMLRINSFLFIGFGPVLCLQGKIFICTSTFPSQMPK